MYCKSCGIEIDVDSQFCSYCGSKQSELNRPKSDKHNPEQTGTQIHTQSDKERKYDLTYSKETDATVYGAFFLAFQLVIIIIQPFKFESIDSYNQSRAIAALVALFYRIFIIYWVVNIANRQNRETLGWGLFAFFLPSIALIIIGQQKKLFAKL